MLHNGIAWQLLPLELGLGSGQTCWRRLERWQQAGVFDQLHRVLLAELGEAKVVFGKASAEFNYHFAWQWTNSSTYAWSWQVPKTMRHGCLHAGVKARYTKWNYNTTEPNYNTKVLERGTAHLVYNRRETWHGTN